MLSKLLTRENLRLWLISVAIGLGVTLFAYVAVQQSLRLSLNDPQWQMAQDASTKLALGATPESVLPGTPVDESSSLAPFMTVVDAHLNVLASSGHINGQVPLPPKSAFPDSQKRGSNWFSWQHNGGVRDAAVIIPYGGPHSGYVLAARSMTRVEETTEHILHLAGLTALGILVAPALILLLL